MTDRPDFSTDELATLFSLRDAMIHRLSLPDMPGPEFKTTFSTQFAVLLLSALSKLLED